MLRILRNIRHIRVTENRPANTISPVFRYDRYAVCEMRLVVTGILTGLPGNISNYKKNSESLAGRNFKKKPKINIA